MSETFGSDTADVLDRFTEALPLVHQIAKFYARAHDWRFELDDLVSAGRHGLLEAARRFEPERGVPFLAYARLRVRGRIIGEIRAKVDLTEGAYRRALALRSAAAGSAHEVSRAAQEIATLRGKDLSPTEAEQALDELMASYVAAAAVGIVSERGQPEPRGDCDVEAELAQRELLALVEQEMAVMDEREVTVLRGRYFQERSIDELAEELGVDRSWVSRLHKKAVDRIARRLAASPPVL